MSDDPNQPSFRIRVAFGARGHMGPGKAELLDRIIRTGSIAAAGREMGMSYKRAWQLVEAMNTMFRAPLVQSSRGGAKGGGAVVTEAGETVLAAYRGIEDEASRAGAAQVKVLRGMLSDMSDGK
jgi:molybdate transport system regulatory protein